MMKLNGKLLIAISMGLVLMGCTSGKAVHICIKEGGDLYIDAPAFPVGTGGISTDLGEGRLRGPALYSSMPMKAEKEKETIIGTQYTDKIFQRCFFEPKDLKDDSP